MNGTSEWSWVDGSVRWRMDICLFCSWSCKWCCIAKGGAGGPCNTARSRRPYIGAIFNTTIMFKASSAISMHLRLIVILYDGSALIFIGPTTIDESIAWLGSFWFWCGRTGSYNSLGCYSATIFAFILQRISLNAVSRAQQHHDILDTYLSLLLLLIASRSSQLNTKQ